MQIVDESNSETPGRYSDPFLLPSNNYVPTSLDDALSLTRMLYYRNPLYKHASLRVISHFITDIDFSGDEGDSEERSAHYDMLMKGVQVFRMLRLMGKEWASYGNSFWRVHFPFTRYLIDHRGGTFKTYALSPFAELGTDFCTYNYKDMTYTIPDPTGKGPVTQRQKVTLKFRDLPDRDPWNIRVKNLDPRHMQIEQNHMSGRKRFIYRFEQWLVNDIHKGNLCQVNDMPTDMLKAIANDQDFKFKEGEIFHLCDDEIAGVSPGGWGVPPPLMNYPNLHQAQVYRKIDEQVGLEYMLPFRIFSPGGSDGVSDAAINTNLGQWMHHMKQVIADHRKNPTNIHAFPLPVTHQEFGASGKQLSPRDIMAYNDETMLDASGYPYQLFKGSLTVEQIPTTLRLFENVFMFLHMGYEGALQWVSDKVRSFQGLNSIQISLQMPSMADDLEQRHVFLQLAAGGEISRAKAYKAFGVKDPLAEAEERMDEDIALEKSKAEKQLAFQKEMEGGSMNDQLAMQLEAQMAQQGGAPGGGAPGGIAMPAGEMNPLDLQQQGEQMAMQLLQIPEDGIRSKELQKIHASNPNLHALVKQKMEEIRSQGASQGRAQAGQM